MKPCQGLKVDSAISEWSDRAGIAASWKIFDFTFLFGTTSFHVALIFKGI
jgi:hypothetical protein